MAFSIQGLSPRVRGNPAEYVAAWICVGSIPARAGEPSTSLPCARTIRVYPRACGGTIVCRYAIAQPVGLSPRVRGNLEAREYRYLSPGSIPARAGEPLKSYVQPESERVYPRACGGTALITP